MSDNLTSSEEDINNFLKELNDNLDSSNSNELISNEVSGKPTETISLSSDEVIEGFIDDKLQESLQSAFSVLHTLEHRIKAGDAYDGVIQGFHSTLVGITNALKLKNDRQVNKEKIWSAKELEHIKGDNKLELEDKRIEGTKEIEMIRSDNREKIKTLQQNNQQNNYYIGGNFDTIMKKMDEFKEEQTIEMEDD